MVTQQSVLLASAHAKMAGCIDRRWPEFSQSFRVKSPCKRSDLFLKSHPFWQGILRRRLRRREELDRTQGATTLLWQCIVCSHFLACLCLWPGNACLHIFENISQIPVQHQGVCRRWLYVLNHISPSRSLQAYRLCFFTLIRSWLHRNLQNELTRTTPETLCSQKILRQSLPVG